MIREFSVKPKPSNNKGRALFICLMLLSFLLVLISTLIPIYKGVVSLFGVALLSVAIMVCVKYVSASYIYDITFEGESTPVFVVRQVFGNRYTTLCRIALSDIKTIKKETREERKAHKTPVECRKYSYLPTLDPAESFRIFSVNRYERAEILIEISDELAALIGDYAREAGADSYDDEEL